MGRVFTFWIDTISTFVKFLFTLKINENPDITIGSFLIACAFIGLIIYFILGTDFIPMLGGSVGSSSSKSTDNNGYVPRHAKGGKE